MLEARTSQPKLPPLTPSRILHLVTVPPKRSMNEHVLSLRRRLPRRGRHLPRNRPDKPRELARDRGGDLRFRLSPRDEAPEARRQAELGLPRDITDDLRQRFLPVRMLATDARNPLIRPCRFGEQAAHVRIAGFGDRAAPHRRPTRVFRGHEPEIGHELARMSETREISEFCNQRNGGEERHAAQGLERGDDGGPALRRRELSELLGESVDPLFGSAIVSRYSCSVTCCAAVGKLRSVNHRRYGSVQPSRPG